MKDSEIRAVEALVAAVSSLLEQLKAPTLTAEGWRADCHNGAPPSPKQTRFAPRQGCAWNNKERRDMVELWIAGIPLDRIAATHRRSDRGIESELMRLLRSADTKTLLDAICKE